MQSDKKLVDKVSEKATPECKHIYVLLFGLTLHIFPLIISLTCSLSIGLINWAPTSFCDVREAMHGSLFNGSIPSISFHSMPIFFAFSLLLEAFRQFHSNI